MPPKKRYWPPRWTEKNGAIYYVTRPDEREHWDGKTWYRLGATEAEAWTEWYRRVESPTTEIQTISDLCDRYEREAIPQLAPKTQLDYRRAVLRLRRVFGHMAPRDLLPKHVYGYMDRRPRVAANREKAVLSAMMTRAVEWGAVDRNLVREVRRRPEAPRDRYVTDDELAAFLALCSPMMAAYVQLKMLTGLRQGQLLSLRRADWDPERKELKAEAAKGGKTVIYRGDALADAIDALNQAGPGKVTSLWLIRNRKGQRYTSDGFRTLWQRAMRRYVEATEAPPFREHDLRAKVASDTEAAHATQLLGHRSSAITERHYRRAPAKVSVLNRPSKPSNSDT